MYEIPVEVFSAGHSYRGKTANLEIDLAGKIKDRFHYVKNIDFGSVTMAEVDQKGNFIRYCPCQFDVNNTLIWLMEGDFPAKTKRWFKVLFNTTDSKEKSGWKIHLVNKNDTDGYWEFATPSGFFQYDRKGGSFRVLSPFIMSEDAKGRDWARNDLNPVQGGLSISDTEGRTIFGAQTSDPVDAGSWDGCKSDIIYGGPVRYRIRSTKRFGKLEGDIRSGSVFSVIYDVFPDFIRAKIVKANDSGLCIMVKLTPGGNSLDSTAYLVASNGINYLESNREAGETAPTWFFTGDTGDSASLFFARVGETPSDLKVICDEPKEKLVAGWQSQPMPGNTLVPGEYFIGFMESRNFAEVEMKVKSFFSDPEIATGAIRRRGNWKLHEDRPGSACPTSWYSLDTLTRTLSNSLISVGYGGDRVPAANNRVSGITEFIYKPFNENMAFALDAYGYDYARYFHGGPSDYKLTAETDEFVEVSVVSSIEGRVHVSKKERIFKDLPVLEIEYSELQLLWLQDFYHGVREENRLYTIFNIPESFGAKKLEMFRRIAEETCGHNFGDCFIAAAGSTLKMVLYKGCLIFGFYDRDTEVGLGFVLPETIGLHDGFKLWNMHSYESFPFHGKEKVMPFKRWIFATSKGQEGIWELGKAIADVHGRNETLSSNLVFLKSHFSELKPSRENPR